MLLKMIISLVLLGFWVNSVHARIVQVKISGDPKESQSITGIWEKKSEKKKVFGFLKPGNEFYAADTQVGTNLSIDFPFLKENVALSKLVIKRSHCPKEFFIESDLIQRISQEVVGDIEFLIEAVDNENCFQIVSTTLDLVVSDLAKNPFNSLSKKAKFYNDFLLEIEKGKNISDEDLDAYLEEIEIITSIPEELTQVIEEMKLGNLLAIKTLSLRKEITTDLIKRHIEKLQKLDVDNLKIKFLEFTPEMISVFQEEELESLLSALIGNKFYFESFLIAGEIVSIKNDQKEILERYPEDVQGHLLYFLLDKKTHLERKDFELAFEIFPEQSDQEGLIQRYFEKISVDKITGYFWYLDQVNKDHVESLALNVFNRVEEISPEGIIQISTYMSNPSYFIQINYEKVNDKSFDALILILDSMESFYIGTIIQDFMSHSGQLKTDQLIKISSYDDFGQEYFLKGHLDRISDLNFSNLLRILELSEMNKDDFISFFLERSEATVSTNELIQLANHEGWSKSRFFLKYLNKVNNLSTENLNLIIAEVDGLSKAEVQKLGDKLIIELNQL